MRTLLIIVLLLSSHIASAQTFETEPNDTQAQANTIASGATLQGQIALRSDVDWYRLDVGAAGTITVTIAVTGGQTGFHVPLGLLMDAAGNAIASGGNLTLISVSGELGPYSYNLQTGATGARTYYVKVSMDDADSVPYTIKAVYPTAAAATSSVISPVYDGSGGSNSYIRLFNGANAASTFSVTVLNASSGVTLGTASIQVPSHASPQYPLVPSGGSNSIFSQASVADSPGTSYALYIQDTDKLTGYQHVTFTGTTTLFENNSQCNSLVNQQLASSNTVALPNVHTSQLSGYPSTVSIANHSNSSTTVTLTIIDAATGNAVGTMNKTIGANATLLLPESQIESQLNFRPTSAQPHINILFTNAAGGAPPIEVGQLIFNSQLGGAINMSSACAVNPVSTATATPALPTAYCGIVTYPSPYSSEVVYFTASVAPDGFIYAAVVDLGGVSAGQGEWYFGTLTGTTATLTGSRGDLLTGTLQNGKISGVFPTPYGNGSYAGSTAACR